jgi:hypothetical protein
MVKIDAYAHKFIFKKNSYSISKSLLFVLNLSREIIYSMWESKLCIVVKDAIKWIAGNLLNR